MQCRAKKCFPAKKQPSNKTSVLLEIIQRVGVLQNQSVSFIKNSRRITIKFSASRNWYSIGSSSINCGMQSWTDLSELSDTILLVVKFYVKVLLGRAVFLLKILYFLFSGSRFAKQRNFIQHAKKYLDTQLIPTKLMPLIICHS